MCNRMATSTLLDFSRRTCASSLAMDEDTTGLSGDVAETTFLVPRVPDVSLGMCCGCAGVIVSFIL